MSVLLPSSTLPAVEKRSRLKSEIALALFDFHRSFLIVIDDAVLALGAPYQFHLVDDLFDRVRFGPDGAGAGAAPERAHPAHDHLRPLAGMSDEILLDRNQRTAPHHHFPRFGIVERHDGDI